MKHLIENLLCRVNLEKKLIHSKPVELFSSFRILDDTKIHTPFPSY